MARTKVEKALFLAHTKGMHMSKSYGLNRPWLAQQALKPEPLHSFSSDEIVTEPTENSGFVVNDIVNVRFGLFTPRWRGEHYLSSLSMQKFCAITLRRAQEGWHQLRAAKLWREHLDTTAQSKREHLDTTAQAKKDAIRFPKIQQKEYWSDDEEFMAIAEDVQNWLNENCEEYGSLDMVSAQKQRDAVQKQKDAEQKDAERKRQSGNVQNNVIPMFKPT